MNRLPDTITRKALLALPHRKWDAVSVYDSLYIVPTRKKHDSGYMMIAVIGANTDADKKHLVGEIAAWCDDINWCFPVAHPYDQIRPGVHTSVLRTDMLFPSGIVHMWASGEHYFKGRFKVGRSLSSTEIELLVWPRGEGRNTATGVVIPMPEIKE